MGLEELESLLDEVANVEAFALGVVDLVAEVGVVHLEQVHHGEDLAVVWHEGLTDGVGAGDETLQDLESDGNNLRVACV